MSLLHSTTGFGHEVASGATMASRELGLEPRATACAPGHVAAAAGRGIGDARLVAGAFETSLRRAAELPDEGPAADWFVATFRDAFGAEPAYPAAAAFAAGVLAANGLRGAGTAKDEAVLRTATQLDMQTLFGHFHLDPDTGLQVGSEILVVQWQAGERRAVWPLPKAERQILPLRGRWLPCYAETHRTPAADRRQLQTERQRTWREVVGLLAAA
ncbi:MAG: ABC transporter substrate-binding protein [Chloroflexi bacterium]|nr:ABC transporter substrate-binding protein [Chloroflexota bacterium]